MNTYTRYDTTKFHCTQVPKVSTLSLPIVLLSRTTTPVKLLEYVLQHHCTLEFTVYIMHCHEGHTLRNNICTYLAMYLSTISRLSKS